MTTNNAINLSASGLAKYDGAGTFAVATGVSDGLTGSVSFTAYGVLCGGTTATNPIQSIDPGISGEILLSNGAGALPSFESVGGGVVIGVSSGQVNMADSTTYWVKNNGTFQTVSNPLNFIYIPISGTLSKFYGYFDVNGTLASNENVTVGVRVNGSSSTNVSTTVQLTADPTTFNNTGLAIAITAGDFIEIFITTPAWATNPTSVSITCSLVIE